MALKIVTDSTAYLDKTIQRDLDVQVVSLSVHFENSSFKEQDITNKDFYQLMDKSSKVPTSSQPSPLDFYKVFQPLAEQGDDILGVFISAGLSGTYFSALTARNMIWEKYPAARIELLDSAATATQLAYCVLVAARAAKNGDPLERVTLIARGVIKSSRMYFVPRTLDYLKKGGRIGGASALFGTLLQVKPILYLKDGKVDVLNKVRTFEKAFSRVRAIFLEDLKNPGVEEVSVVHINVDTEARQVAEILKGEYGIIPAVNSIGPVIGLHAGPGTMGLAYYLKG